MAACLTFSLCRFVRDVDTDGSGEGDEAVDTIFNEENAATDAPSVILTSGAQTTPETITQSKSFGVNRELI